MSDKPQFDAKELTQDELSDAELDDVSGGSCGGTCSPARCSGGCDGGDVLNQ